MLPAPISFLLLFYFFTLPLSVFAQSSSDLYSQAIQVGTGYRAGYAQYIQAKNQFLQYGTAAARLSAIAKTQTVLAGRNNWQIAYLKYLRTVLADSTNIANYPQTVAYLDMETEINHHQDLSFTQDSFPALNTASLAWEKRLSNTDNLVAATQIQIAAARLANLQNTLATHIPASPSASQKTTVDLIVSKLDESLSLRKKVDSQLTTYRSTSWSKSTQTQLLQNSYRLLLEAARLLAEIIRSRP